MRGFIVRDFTSRAVRQVIGADGVIAVSKWCPCESGRVYPPAVRFRRQVLNCNSTGEDV